VRYPPRAVLHLESTTSDDWAPWAVEHIGDLLIDHAHCEKKAASSALALMFKYPHHGALLVPLCRLAREELAHFEQVLGCLRDRGLEFRRMRPSPYAAQLMEVTRHGEPEHLVDTLLCCSLIEARSCERMQLLAQGLVDTDPELAALYEGLLASEARHHDTYVDLARAIDVLPEPLLRKRLTEIAVHEARCVADAPWVPRLHNGN
jgi:tRNA-(ms[2]io[6]A)-hydroxylase